MKWGKDMEQGKSRTRDAMVARALQQMESALQLIDEAAVPGDIGAHLDLAVCRLKEVMPSAADNVQQGNLRTPGCGQDLHPENGARALPG